MAGGRPGTSEIAMEPLHAGQPGIVDGLEIGVNAFLGDIASDEMEPCLRIEHLVRLTEVGFIL